MALTTDQWINVLAASGTIAAAFVAAYSARLAWKQVAFQFEPRLIFVRTGFQVKVAPDLLGSFWWKEPSEEGKYINGGETEYRFTIRNLGAGPAFDIRTYVEFDYEAVYADVLSKLGRRAGDLSFEVDDFGMHPIVNGESVGGFRLPDQAAGMIDSIGPALSSKAKKRCLIDPSLALFAMCYAIYQMMAHKDPDEEEARRRQVIPFGFRIEFTDARGTRRVTRSSLRLVVDGGHYKEDGSDGVALISVGPAD